MKHGWPQEQRAIDWGKVIETALTAPGSMGSTYERFYSYLYLNQMYLLMQGVREPIGTFKRWQSIGRTVLKGSKAKEIIVPIMAGKKEEDGKSEPVLVGFKPVRCIFIGCSPIRAFLF